MNVLRPLALTTAVIVGSGCTEGQRPYLTDEFLEPTPTTTDELGQSTQLQSVPLEQVHLDFIEEDWEVSPDGWDDQQRAYARSSFLFLDTVQDIRTQVENGGSLPIALGQCILWENVDNGLTVVNNPILSVENIDTDEQGDVLVLPYFLSRSTAADAPEAEIEVWDGPVYSAYRTESGQKIYSLDDLFWAATIRDPSADNYTAIPDPSGNYEVEIVHPTTIENPIITIDDRHPGVINVIDEDGAIVSTSLQYTDGSDPALTNLAAELSLEDLCNPFDSQYSEELTRVIHAP